jgi:hypothetical protein
MAGVGLAGAHPSRDRRWAAAPPRVDGAYAGGRAGRPLRGGRRGRRRPPRRVRGGLGVTDALGGLARFGPPALRGELTEVATQAAILGLPQALEGFARRLGDPLADLLAATLALNQRLGGRNLAEVLDELAAAIRAEAHTLREVRARQAQQRLSARLVAAAPVGILLAIRQTNPAYLTPFNTPLGQGVLALALLLVATGYAAMVRLARPPAGTRLLPTTPTTPATTRSPRWAR